MSWYGRSQPRHRSHLLPLLLSISVVFFLVLFALSSFGHHSSRPLHASKFKDANNGDRRRVGEVEGGGNLTMLLAKERTHRKDPTDGFKRYNGGWNITNSHYWASTTYTALPFFAIAAVWFVIFGLTLIFVCLFYCCYSCCCCCCPEQSSGYSHTCYTAILVLFSLCTVASVVACVLLYFGQGKFHLSTRHTLDYIKAEADRTAENLTSVATFLDSAQKIGVYDLTLPQEMQDRIAQITRTSGSVAKQIKHQTHVNYKRIMDVIDIVRKVLIGLASVMLVLVLAGSMLSLCGAKCLLYMLVILGWILVTATLVLSGVFLVLHNVVSDTCVAMDEWVSHPTVHTSLDDILPCVDIKESQAILRESKVINLDLITFVDTVLSNVSNRDIPPDVPGVYYNQSGPLLPLLCKPFNRDDLSDRTCSTEEVDYSHATKVWKKNVCKVGGDGNTCITTGRLNPAYFNQVNNVKNISYNIYAYTPFLVHLTDCTFVHNTFRDVTKIYCPGIRKYTKRIHVGLAFVSFAVMLSLISWGFYAQERRNQRVSSKDLANQGPDFSSNN